MISTLEKWRKSIATPVADNKIQFPDSVIPRHSAVIKTLRLCQKSILRLSVSVFLQASSSWSNFILMPCQKPVSPLMSQNIAGNFFGFIEQFTILAKYTEGDTMK
jgi:hypothetical protein